MEWHLALASLLDAPYTSRGKFPGVDLLVLLRQKMWQGGNREEQKRER